MRILIADDEPSERALTEAVVVREGHQAITVGDGHEALAACQRERPDLLLLDVMMPGMNGYEVAGEIRRRDEEWIPILFLSGLTDDEEIVRGLQAGGDDYLLKPVAPRVLAAKLQAMQRLLGMRRELVSLSQRLQQTNEELRLTSLNDSLTGIANRRCLDATLAQEWRRCMRAGKSLALLLLDIDYFKEFNDCFGHQRGDECLARVAGVINGCARRASDLAARYGGEEFAMVLPETDMDGAVSVAARIQQELARIALPHPGSRCAGVVTLSVGCAAIVPYKGGAGFHELVRDADRLLYAAKAAGRNRIATDSLRVGVA